MTTASYNKRTKPSPFPTTWQTNKPKVNWPRVTITVLAVALIVLTVATSIKVWSV